MANTLWNATVLFSAQSKALSLMKEQLRRYNNKAHFLQKTLTRLALGRISTDLLDKRTIVEVINELRKMASLLQVTLGNNINLKHLKEISEVRFGTNDAYASITITVPLLKMEPIVTFKIHTLPVPQILRYNNNTSLKILSKKNYLLLQDENHAIASMSEYYNPSACKATKTTLLCDKTWMSFTNQTSCEYELFRRPKKMSLELCNLQFRNR